MRKLFLFIIIFSNAVFAQMPSGLSVNPLLHIESSNVTLSGSTVTGVNDLSGNGYNFTSVGNPQVTTGINGLQAIQFNGSNHIRMKLPLNRADLTKLNGFIVFKITAASGVTYHNIAMIGATNYTTAGSNIFQLYNNNSSNGFNANFATTSLKTTVNATQLDLHTIYFNKDATGFGIGIDNQTGVVTTGAQNIANKEIYIGQWNGRGAKMQFYEFCIFDNVPTINDWDLLKLYVDSKYGVQQVGVEVINKGVNGNNSADIVSRLADINSENADLVILGVGVNDWRHPTASKRQTPAQYEANLITAIQSFKANGSDVLLINFPQILQDETDYVCGFYGLPSGCEVNCLSESFREKIFSLASLQNVGVIDFKKEFQKLGEPNILITSMFENNANSGSADGVHFRPNGALKAAQIIYSVIQSMNYNKIVMVGDSNTYGDGLTGAGTNTGETIPAQLKILLN